MAGMGATKTRRTDSEKRSGTDEYARFVKRCIRAIGRRVMAGDLPSVDSLVQLREIREDVDARTAEVVHALRSEAGGAHSWAEIGEALGVTRAAAFKKYGAAETDARQAGGQPARLR